MANQCDPYQPGPVFYDVWAGALRAAGKTVADGSREIGVSAPSARLMASGALNGPKAQETRRAMVASVGEDIFRALYDARMRTERAAA